MNHPEIDAIERNGMPTGRDEAGNLSWGDGEEIDLVKFMEDFFRPVKQKED
jgi:hypothetical protein